MTFFKGQTVETTFYAQVEPKIGYGWNATTRKNDPCVEKITVVAITQSRPAKPRSGVVVVKLTLQFPVEAFMPLEPSAIIQIPLDMVELGQAIEVEAVEGDDASLRVTEFLAEKARQP